MAPPILFLENIHLTFGGQALIETASLSVEAGDRICLVGRNGSGKSTFLKIAAGSIEPDSGERFLQPGTTIRYLHQEPDMDGFATIGDYVHAGLAPGDDTNRADYLMARLGLREDAAPNSVSGGEARRAALARTLAPAPDILLLDEPTNHLDLPAIEWLEEELLLSTSALVLISHDRRFLSSLSRKTVWIDRGQTRVLEKGFGAFEDWRDNLLEQEETERHKLGRKIVREEHWITHGVSGRRRRNMRRLDELAALRDRLKSARRVSGDVSLSSADAAQSGKLVAELKEVSKSFGGKPVVSRFSTIIRRGDRIGIAGPNGAGKTTLVNVITGILKPDAGTIRLGVNLEPLVIDQKREALDSEASLRDVLTGGGDLVRIGTDTKHVMGYMKDYLFAPEQANTPVSALSGGERGRLMLAQGLRMPSNLLILDEPTNDLDLETLDLLQEFIAGYDGTVILVSHDRDFLDRICTSLIHAEGDGIWREYAGGYTDMLAQQKAVFESGNNADRAKKPGNEGRSGGTQRESGNRKARLSFKQKHALETLPREIGKLEEEIAKLEKALADPGLYSRERRKFDAFTQALNERKASLEALETEWLELELLREQLEA